SATTEGSAKPAAANAASARSAPTPCNGVYAMVRSRGTSASTSAAASRTYSNATSSPRRRPADPRGTRDNGPTAPGPAPDFGIHGRHALRAVAVRSAEARTQIALVPVVLRRVMAGGDHHAGRRTEPTDGVREDRGRQRPRQHECLTAGSGNHARGLLGERG